MSLLEDIKTLEGLFEQIKATIGSYLVVEPKHHDPLEHTDLSREMGVPDWDPDGFLADDFPRDEEQIKINREWVLEKTGDKYAPSPSDVEKFSPYDKDRCQDVQKWIQEARSPAPSKWVAHATKELERTGARRALPVGFKDYCGLLAEKDTIYVGAPPK